MLKVFWFSTSTLPSRSNSTPRGAGSGSLRRWLFSAISLELLVLGDLEDPEADRQRREDHRDDVLQHRQPDRQAAAVVGASDMVGRLDRVSEPLVLYRMPPRGSCAARCASLSAGRARRA